MCMAYLAGSCSCLYIAYVHSFEAYSYIEMSMDQSTVDDIISNHQEPLTTAATLELGTKQHHRDMKCMEEDISKGFPRKQPLKSSQTCKNVK